MVVKAGHRLPLRDVVSRGDEPQTNCLATEFKEELRRTIATHSTFSNAIHVHDRSCTRQEPHHSRRPVARSSRATSINRDRRAILTDEVMALVSKPGCTPWVRHLHQRSAWPRSELDNSKTTCVDRLCATVQRFGQATHPCHQC